MACTSGDRSRRAAAALLALAAALGVAGCGESKPAGGASRTDGAPELGYLRDRDGLWDVVLHDRGRPVVRHARGVGPLAFSFTADGARAVVLESSNTAQRLIAVEVDDGRRREIAAVAPPAYYTVAAAPDGERLAAVRAGGSGHDFVIEIVGADGKPARTVGEDVDIGSGIAWSADGRTIAYTHSAAHHGGGSGHVRLVDVETGAEQTFGDRLSGSDPTFASDGTLAFARRGRIVLRPAGGGPLRRVTGGPGQDSRPAFSPDGRSIAYQHQPRCRRRRACPTDVFVVPVDGGRPRNLTKTPRVSEGFPGWRP